MPDREMTSLATVVPRSTAGTSLIAPPKVPIAVLRGVEITISVPLPLVKLMFLLVFRCHLALSYQNAYTYKRPTAPNFATRSTNFRCLRSQLRPSFYRRSLGRTPADC